MLRDHFVRLRRLSERWAGHECMAPRRPHAPQRSGGCGRHVDARSPETDAPAWQPPAAGFEPVRLFIRPPDMAAEIGAVDFDLAGQFAFGLFGADRLAQFVRQHESRFVLTIKIAAELQGRNSLNRIHKDADCREVITDREFSAGEDGSACHAELMIAALAFPDTAHRIGIDRYAFTPRTVRLAAVVGEPDGAKPIMGFLIRHTKDRRQGERSSLLTEKEVLRHARNMRNRSSIVNMLKRSRIKISTSHVRNA